MGELAGTPRWGHCSSPTTPQAAAAAAMTGQMPPAPPPASWEQLAGCSTSSARYSGELAATASPQLPSPFDQSWPAASAMGPSPLQLQWMMLPRSLLQEHAPQLLPAALAVAAPDLNS